MAWTAPNRGKTNVPSINEALAGMASKGAPRQPTGTAAITSTRNASAEAAGPKKRTKNLGGSADPTTPPQRNARSSVSVSGASYGIRAMIVKPNNPAAGATQASGRTIPSATPRARQAFDGASANYV